MGKYIVTPNGQHCSKDVADRHRQVRELRDLGLTYREIGESIARRDKKIGPLTRETIRKMFNRARRYGL